MVDDPLAGERAFELAVEASPHGILVVDSSGTIVLANRQVERQFGYARDELVGQLVERLVPASLSAAHAARRQAFAGASEARPMGAGHDLHLHARRKDGSEILVEIGLSLVRTDRGEFVLASVADITERRRLAADGRAAVEERRAFERMVADLSGQFVNLPLERIDATIHEALRRVSEARDIDRSTLYELSDDRALVEVVSWAASDATPPAPALSGERFSWTFEQCLSGRQVSFASVAELSDVADVGAYRAAGMRSALMIPLSVAGRIAGALAFYTVRHERAWSGDVHHLRVIASVFAQVLARRSSDRALRKAIDDVERLKRDLEVENVQLRTQARTWLPPSAVVGQSDAVRRVMEQIHHVAATDSTVLLLGETGTGKELFAAQIHELGPRRQRAMVRTNCAAIPSTLIESELFGREKGAFTGALARQIGRFELASGSTLFLDEIGDLPADVQVKLLRVLEEGQLERLGSSQPLKVDCRIVAATHRNLEGLVAAGSFREDLYYRLNVFPIRVPPLRERAEDISMLAWRFIDEFSKTFGKRVESIAPESLAALARHSWPGNIRELRNVIERAMITATGPCLTITLPSKSRSPATHSSRLIDVEREHISGVLDSTGWRIRGSGGAAEQLGLKPTTLETRLHKLGLKRPAPRYA